MSVSLGQNAELCQSCVWGSPSAAFPSYVDLFMALRPASAAIFDLGPAYSVFCADKSDMQSAPIMQLA